MEYNLIPFSELIDNPKKYIIIKSIYDTYKDDYYKNDYWRIFKNSENNVIQYEEFEYKFDIALEEFRLFANTFEFNYNKKKIIDSFMLDQKSNIKFMGWKDVWEIHY